MNHKLFKRLIICLAIGIFVSTIGCAAKRVTVVYEKDGSHGYSGSGHKHKHKGNGPPPHAPAHGYRAKHQYRYYPSCSVYYDSGRRLYFYLKGDNWEVGASLPSHLRAELGGYVSIELDTDKPYKHYKEHKAKYPPGQMKKKHKKKDKWG